jgi:1,4-alpha-glucan branching enzyme
MWNGPLVEWTWPVIWEIEERFWALAPRALEQERAHEILAQAARSMLLLQSSDWQFIISTGEVEDYAIRRFNGHAEDCRNLLNALDQVVDGGDSSEAIRLTRELQARDDVFREILPSIALALQHQEARVVS